MKYLEKTESYISIINNAITELESYIPGEECIICSDPDECHETLRAYLSQIRKIDLEEIKREFFESCEDYSKLQLEKEIFQLRFEKLLNWGYDYSTGLVINHDKYNFVINEFFSHQIVLGFQLEKVKEYNITSSFVSLCAAITLLKHRISKIIRQLERLVLLYEKNQIEQKNIQVQYSYESTILPKKVKTINPVNFKSFPEYLLHKDKIRLAEAIRNDFSNIKGKSVRLLLYAMETFDPPLITLRSRQGKEIYDSMSHYFNGTIGAYQTTLAYIIVPKTDQPDIDSMKVCLNHIVKEIEKDSSLINPD